MAHFRATIQGNRGKASRLGTKKSGIVATVNGWNVGVDVVIKHNEETGKDVITVIPTSGSNHSKAVNYSFDSHEEMFVIKEL